MSALLHLRARTAPQAGFIPVGRLLPQRERPRGTPAGKSEEYSNDRLGSGRRASARTAHPQVPPIVHDGLRSPGQPLDPATRDFMEPRFGHDFGKVRVHTDAKAAKSARAVGAAGSPAECKAAARVAQGGWGVVSAKAEPGTLQREEAEVEGRLRLQNPGFGEGLGFRPPRIGFDLPGLQLDPQIAMQIRAIQFAHGLLSIENIMAASGQIGTAGFGAGSSAAPVTAPSLVPPPGSLGGGGPAGAAGQPLPARPPLVPRGRGPETPRAATVGDLMKAVLKVPAVQAGVERLRTQGEGELRTNWESLSGGERALVITQGVVMSAGIIARVASDPEASRFVLDKVQGQNIPIPGLPMTFQFNLTGPDQRLLIGLDVGALLPTGSGFGPRR